MPPSKPDAEKVPHTEQSSTYIRTFARDMDTLQKGGVPELSSVSSEGESSVPVAPTAPAPQPTAVPQPQPLPIKVPPPAPKMEELVLQTQPTEEPRPMPLKTYSSDFAERMKETNASTATVIAAEQNASPYVPPSVEKVGLSRSSVVYSIAGVLLFLIAGIGGYFAYTHLSVAPVLVTPTARARIFFDEQDTLSGSGTTLMQAMQQSATRTLPNGSVRLLSLEEGNTTNVFKALQLPLPGVLLRNISDTGSMAGIVRAGESQYPFFILSVTSFGDTFAGMLTWEAMLPRDVEKLFPPYPAKTIDTTLATSTSPSATVATTTTLGSKIEFVDATVVNHDVRVYRDALGRDILLYGYWDQATLVIARDVAAFTEILGRLATSRTQR